MPLALTLQSFSQLKTSSVLSRVSTTLDGAEGTSGSFRPSISADGRYVAFDSEASNLAAGDTNGKNDVFLKNLKTGEITRLSTAADGVQGNGNSFIPKISPDGKFITFDSDANNLVVGDGNLSRDIFRKDLSTGVIVRLNTNIDGLEANSASAAPALSPDGRYMVFMSMASNLTADDTNNKADVFLKDLWTGAITRASTARDGAQSNGNSHSASLSSDGRYVLFQSDASNLVSNDTNASQDIFYKDLVTDAVVRVSTSTLGAQANAGSNNAKISANGRFVVFESAATNLVDGDTNGKTDVFRKDLVTGEILCVSTAGNGLQGAGDSLNASISADGRFVVFESTANDLVGDMTSTFRAIFRKDLQTGEIIRISAGIDGTAANGDSREAKLTADGRYIVFESDASNLAEGDTNGATDTFWVDTSLLANGVAISQGRVIELSFKTGSATSAKIAWGDGTYSTIKPLGGIVSSSHTYASTGIKSVLVTAKEGSTSWTAPYVVNLTTGVMIRKAGVADTITGSSGADRLNGDGYANKIMGRAGNDVINGGAGNDILSGGTGADRFVFSKALNKSTNLDTISDFNVQNDAIYLENIIFTKLSKTGTLSSSFLKIGTKASDTNDYLVYNKTMGILFYDADGSGKGAAIAFAKVKAGTALTHDDFYVI